MNLQALKLYSLMEPPPSGLAGLVVERVHGSIGQQLLDDPTFEPNVPEPYRRIAAASLETAYAGGYWIKKSQSQKVIFTHTAYFLQSSRPANPCLALSFIEVLPDSSKPRLLTLLLYNEFQQKLGIYIHDTDTFVIYQNAPVEVASAFFVKERGRELIDHLRQIQQRFDLKKLARRSVSNHAFAFGFNKSFGHAHWNDVLGFLSVRHYPVIGESPILVSHCLLGQTSWLSPKTLISQVSLSCESVKSCTDYLLSTSTCAHVPLGFSIGKEYERFWRYEVTAEIKQPLQLTLRQFRGNYWPIILFGLRSYEWWRKGWRSQGQQVLEIIDYLLQRYPKAGFIFDGLTAFHGEVKQIPTSNSSLLDCANQRWGHSGRFLDLAGASIEEKVATYQIADYGISQFGSGDAIPHWVYSLPSITISAEPQIISAYSDVNTITRQCKKGLENPLVCGHFLPIEHLLIEGPNYELTLNTALPYIVSHLDKYAKSDRGALLPCTNGYFSVDSSELEYTEMDSA